jgi:hypothetical protein
MKNKYNLNKEDVGGIKALYLEYTRAMNQQNYATAFQMMNGIDQIFYKKKIDLLSTKGQSLLEKTLFNGSEEQSEE